MLAESVSLLNSVILYFVSVDNSGDNPQDSLTEASCDENKTAKLQRRVDVVQNCTQKFGVLIHGDVNFLCYCSSVLYIRVMCILFFLVILV